MRAREFSAGMLLGLTLFACAGASYRYYTLDIADGCYKDGKLLAHDPKDDKPLSLCQPQAGAAMPCAVMLDSERLRLFNDYDKCMADLRDCEGGG